MTLTKEQFIQWSFERDRDLDLLGNVRVFEQLDSEEQEAYTAEAEYYFSGRGELGWPADIVQRAMRENIDMPE